MKKKGIKKDLFAVSVITIITITVWLVLDIFLTFQKKAVPAVLQKQMEPLNPKLNMEVLEELEKKEYFDFTEEDLLPAITITPGTEIPAASPAAETQEIPTGTESANF